MNYEQKSEEVFAELFHESWMTASDWSNFKNKAAKMCKYGTMDFAKDLESGKVSHVEVDAKLSEIKRRVKL